MTIGEIWRACEGNVLAFLVLLPSKIGLAVITPGNAAAIVRQRIPIDPGDIPRHAMKAISNHVSHLKDADYELIHYSETPLLEETRELFSALMLSADGVTGAGVLYMKEPHKVISAATLVTRCSDGSYIGTTSEPRLFNMPTHFHFQHFVGMPANRLHDRHQERLHEAELHGMRFHKYTPQTVAKDSLRFIHDLGNHLIARGVFVEIPDAEVEDIFWRRGDDHDD